MDVDLNEAMIATVRAEAAAKKLSIKDLASAAGISHRTLNNYLYLGRGMNLQVVDKLATGLEMETLDLLRLAVERRARMEAGATD